MLSLTDNGEFSEVGPAVLFLSHYHPSPGTPQTWPFANAWESSFLLQQRSTHMVFCGEHLLEFSCFVEI